MNKTKRCCRCKKIKFIDEFHKNKNKPDGLRMECKKCANEITKLYREKNPQRVRLTIKKWYEKNKGGVIEYTNKYNQSRDDGLYSKYWSMKRRCEYPSQSGWKWYGAKGIVVEWNSYTEFKKDMYRTYKNHLAKYGHKQTTIGRIDSNKNYCKENCRWETWKQQGKATAKVKKVKKKLIHTSPLAI